MGRPETKPKEQVREIGRFGNDYLYVDDQQVIADILEQCGLPPQRAGFLLLREGADNGWWSEVWSSGVNRIPLVDCTMRRLL
jgi:hypothetical protein